MREKAHEIASRSTFVQIALDIERLDPSRDELDDAPVAMVDGEIFQPTHANGVDGWKLSDHDDLGQHKSFQAISIPQNLSQGEIVNLGVRQRQRAQRLAKLFKDSHQVVMAANQIRNLDRLNFAFEAQKFLDFRF